MEVPKKSSPIRQASTEAFVEKVDRKTITASHYVSKTVTPSSKRMDPCGQSVNQTEGVKFLPVVEDERRTFLGYVWLNDVLELAEKKEMSLEKALKTEVPSVYSDYTVEEMLPLISGNNYPLAVVDKQGGRLLGLVTQTSLIIEATRYGDEEVKQLIKKANKTNRL